MEHCLTGGLPQGFGSIANSLEILHLGGNEINSTLEETWGSISSWPHIQKLSLQDNYFYGTLPTAWAGAGRWDNLQLLNASNNHLQGGIPGTLKEQIHPSCKYANNQYLTGLKRQSSLSGLSQ